MLQHIFIDSKKKERRDRKRERRGGRCREAREIEGDESKGEAVRREKIGRQKEVKEEDLGVDTKSAASLRRISRSSKMIARCAGILGSGRWRVK